MVSRSQRKLWRSLRRGKGRDRHGLFLAEGSRLVAELLDSGVQTEHVVYTAAALGSRDAADLVGRAEATCVPTSEVDCGIFRELTETITPQGILAVAVIPSWGWPDVKAPRILVLDAVGDPGNLGTLVRTAEAIGVGGVVCLPGTVDPWNPKAVRAGAGSSFRLPVFFSGQVEAVEEMGRWDMTMWAAVPGASPLRRGEAAPARLALVLGSESHGVSEALLGQADRSVSLPMRGSVESLNVAVAGGILMDRVFGA